MEANWPAEAEEAEARYDSVAAGGRDTAECPQVTEGTDLNCLVIYINHLAPQYAQLAQYQSSLPASPGPNLKM